MRVFKNRKSWPLRDDTADIAVDSIHIEIPGEEEPLVRAHYRLRARDSADKRGVLVDFSGCPLVPLEIYCDELDRVDLRSQSPRDRLVLDLKHAKEGSWDNSIVTLVMRWAFPGARPSLVDMKFLYAPQELPSVGAPADDLSLMSASMPITVEEDSDRFVAGGICSQLDRPYSRAGPFVQAVFCKDVLRFCCPSAGKPVEVCVLSESADIPSKGERESICNQVQKMSSYFAERLSVHAGLRIALATDSLPSARSMPGALLTAPRSWYSTSTTEQNSKEFQIARMVADVWWGGGCRVNGGQGVFIGSGIAFAMGLDWTRSRTPRAYFDAQISYFRERLVERSRIEWSESRPGERTIPIGIAIFDGMTARESVWERLGQLAREYWGREVPEDVVLRSLESAGVKIAHFESKRFRR